MRTVWKVILKPVNLQEIEVPKGATALTVREQQGVACIWYWCNPDEPKERRKIAIVGTGTPAPTPRECNYLGTAILHDGEIVAHVFEHKGLLLQ